QSYCPPQSQARMTWEVAGFKPATRLSQAIPASVVRSAVSGWCHAICVARQPIGRARVNAPWIKRGLPLSKSWISRSRPEVVVWGNQPSRSSFKHGARCMALLLKRQRERKTVLINNQRQALGVGDRPGRKGCKRRPDCIVARLRDRRAASPAISEKVRGLGVT